MASISRALRRITQSGLRRLGYQLVRMDVIRSQTVINSAPADTAIGHEICVRTLAERGYIPHFVVDIGAASGMWTKLALRHWPEARFLLIEPLEEHRTHLAELCASAPNVEFMIAGAGSESGELMLGVQAQLDGSSFLYPGREQRKVPVVTVDALIERRNLPPPQVMKLDVQGYELRVLSGAQKALKTCDLVIVELQFFRFAPGMALVHEAMQWMVQHGFRLCEIVDVLRRPLDGAMGQCDLMFAREGHWLVSRDSWG